MFRGCLRVGFTAVVVVISAGGGGDSFEAAFYRNSGFHGRNGARVCRAG